ncbi:MerR family transcriptional regulator [Gymnodinialimonas sp. 2305UL16-5]|uniref:helix-turn-helix domain-containing protein n=1 Tax=Gymnodinialimonas mytili TaxID=3126503 RepID=UPI003097BBE8
MKAFCEATGLTRDTVNFYVRLGLIEPAGNGSATNSYRDFDEDQVEAAQMITMAKSLGFSLNEIKHLAERYRSADMDTYAQASILREQLVKLEERRSTLEAMEQALNAKLARIEAKTETPVGEMPAA